MQQVFEKFFKKTTNPSTGILRSSQGATFGNPGSVLLFFVFAVLIILAVVSIIQSAVLISLIILSLSVLLMGYILDIQGIEVNFKKNQIRRYSSFLGFRRGSWFDLDSFEKIGITHDLLLEKRKLYPRPERNNRYSKHNFYTLVLINDNERKVIPIYENENVHHVKKAGNWFAHHTSMRFYSEIFKNGYEYC